MEKLLPSELPNKKLKYLFLDIETTGLSRYYDQITVIGYDDGQKHHYHVQGDELNHFTKTLGEADVLITFNGTLFDVKFLQHHIQNLIFPRYHVDLRYLMRRAGYTGGQKKIEVALGVKRESDLIGVTGYEAVVLWHEFRRGNPESLQKLLRYNHSDVQGMKSMLSFAIKELTTMKFPFKECEFKTTPIKKIPQAKKVKPLVTISDLRSRVSGTGPIIGIDLTGSEKRPSGTAILFEDNSVTTKLLHTNEELINLCKENNPLLISIDSPLGIPKGRTKVTDDDETRYVYGIMRWSERELKRRGVNVYPCLIPSMQRLTERGMMLASTLRKLGYTVIESYPGAAQDIMQIPRKQAGLPYLKDGLLEFGIKKGKWYDHKISHDELDAITSAIVGLFYEANMYEGLGNDDEEYLIIPKL